MLAHQTATDLRWFLDQARPRQLRSMREFAEAEIVFPDPRLTISSEVLFGMLVELHRCGADTCGVRAKNQAADCTGGANQEVLGGRIAAQMSCHRLSATKYVVLLAEGKSRGRLKRDFGCGRKQITKMRSDSCRMTE